jgi:hypothetical protein
LFYLFVVSFGARVRHSIAGNVLEICAEMALLAEPLSHRTKLNN